ncbi:LLM class flavin-dependent oxidoreductase [Fictibacillus fluitans]|uniref:LLM class flavin-dependent oxidoreductase n=1 Tax=Fictibacillus fluitans TaxID=3058422 RepID=A0ABT8HUW3_9BACL|nr:LLM class flavin-dependent oxidoreductase [Fictibacillus sp. NE201]MDN4524568.1 LLM class flavin-dependent oxidoreductase [Fictibacillus sp. NE201]
MSQPERQLHLNLFLTGMGHHEAAWRHPQSDIGSNLKLSHYVKLAQKAEAAKFDSLFLADRYAVSRQGAKYGLQGGIEPLTLLSALAAVTENIGLIATVSTSFNEPYNVARRFASLDHISNGRAGWNVITSGTDGEAQNFNSKKIPSHGLRYEKAREFLEVASKLWDSWGDDAIIADQEAGIFADERKVHEIHHRGNFFSVKGPLNIPRSPQGRPVLVQAGSSADGIDFAGQYAEAVFTAQQTLEEAQRFYQEIKTRAAAFGRSPESVKVLPGICPVIGRTEAEAKEKEAQLHDYTNTEFSLYQLSNRVGADLTAYPLDGPLPQLPATDGHQSRTKLIQELAFRENLTIRQLLLRLAGGRGHYTIAGTPEQISDQLEKWFKNKAADGFNIMPQLMSEGLDDFITYVLPLLQERGLFRTEYSGTTLREHLGLKWPDTGTVNLSAQA